MLYVWSCRLFAIAVVRLSDAGIQFETSHAVTHRSGGCERVAEAVAAFLEAL